MKKTSKTPSILISLFGILMGSLSLYFMIEREEHRVSARTLSKTYKLKDQIETEFLRSENVLRGIEGLFHSSEEVTRKEYATFCQNAIDEKIPLHLVEWQPKVTSEERKSYEAKGKRDGVKDFHFFEINEDGEEVPAKVREFHFPVFYSYSPESSYQAVGLDLAFSPERMKSKYVSMKTGTPAVSGTFDVIVKNTTERNSGFAITYPVFNDPTISSSHSLKHLKGFIAIVLYLNDFFEPISKREINKNFQFEILDQGNKGQTIFQTLKKGEFAPKFAERMSFDVGNRQWELIVYPTQVFLDSEITYLPWIVFILVLIVSFGFSSYLYIKGLNHEKIYQYQRQLQQKQKLESVGILASGIAHEFNNILQCISLANENLKMAKLDSLKIEHIETSLSYCKKGRGLVRQILSFARYDSGMVQEILPSEEIESTLKLLKTSLGNDVRFVCDIDSHNDKPLLMNINHISQIIINLCNNAAHAMDSNGVINVTYKIFPNERVLMVSDNGVGMSSEVLEKIFDPFYTTKAVNEGTGLGLSVIYGIVKSYNGQIEVNSKLGKGSEFKITFPA